MQNSEVQFLNLLIVAYPAFVEPSLVLKHVSLTSLALAKAKQNWFGDRVDSIADCVAAAISLPDNLVVVSTIAKTQPWMRFQNLTTVDARQRSAHWIGQTLGCLRRVTLSARVAAYIANTGEFMRRAPS